MLRLPKGCGHLSGKVVRLSNVRIEASLAYMTCSSNNVCLKIQCFEQYIADVCVFRLTEDGRVAITAVVHVDNMFCGRAEGKVLQVMR